MDTLMVDRFIREMGWVPTDSLRGQVRRGLASTSADVVYAVGTPAGTYELHDKPPAGVEYRILWDAPPVVSHIVSELEVVERVARSRGSPTCDHLASRIATIREALTA